MILDTNALSAWADGDPAIEPLLRTASRLVVRLKPCPRIAWYKKTKSAKVAIRLNGEPRFRGNRLSASG